jgi:hypothetical protein
MEGTHAELESSIAPIGPRNALLRGGVGSRDVAVQGPGRKSSVGEDRIYSMTPGQDPKPLSKEIGRLDGLYQMADGDLIVTDWDTGTVFAWSEKSGMTTLASGFKGPADLCAFPHEGGLMVVVPDLVTGDLRMIQLGN